MECKNSNFYSPEEKEHIFENEFLPHIHSIYNFAYRITFNEAVL
jgi:RNA polymerase sigma-70 factor (ECF subfamily)